MARALVVGVSGTRFGDGLFPDIPGADDDAARISETLRHRGFGVAVPSADALNANAVAAALVKFVDETRPGDLAVIYLAGHGYRTPDISGDEPDRWDESFVCRDKPIPDDWFRAELWPRARAGTKFVVVVDACHSATVTLGLTDTPPVSLPEPVLGRAFYHLTLSACRDADITWDRVSGDCGGGVVTSELLDTMKARADLSYGALWKEVATLVRDRYTASGVGVPQLSYSGPDDSLLNARAFVA